MLGDDRELGRRETGPPNEREVFRITNHALVCRNEIEDLRHIGDAAWGKLRAVVPADGRTRERLEILWGDLPLPKSRLERLFCRSVRKKSRT
jgi:hypothetical protein